jgi:hypothetical protein
VKLSILVGLVQRNGASGSIVSVFFGEPDLNLIEVSNTVSTP